MALPWFRVYSDLLNSRKFHRLSDTLKGRLLCAWCLAAKNDGILPGLEDVAFALRIEDAEAQKAIEGLIEAGFLDRDEHGVVSAHDWQDHQHVSDVSTKRVQQYREKVKRRGTVSGNGVKQFPKRSETVLEAEEKQNRLRADTETPSAAKNAAACDIADETFDMSDSERAEVWNGTGSGNSHSPPKKSRLSPEIESALAGAAGRIYARHPALRRCGLGEVKSQLRAILRGDKLRRVPPGKRLELLHSVDANHAGWCATADWQKENGQYAKGLEKWLAPTKERWAEPPPHAARQDRPRRQGGSTIEDEILPPGINLPTYGGLQ